MAVIDSGLYAHEDFRERILAYLDLAGGHTRLKDGWGHGTHMAGIIAGNGHQSKGKVMGVAPEARLVAVRIATMEQAQAGLDWVLAHRQAYQIGVVNLSIGQPATCSHTSCRCCQAVERATLAGLTVVAAAGNDGAQGPGSITTPGISPHAITVGGVDDRGTPDPDDDAPYLRGSRGPTAFDGLAKPDVLAPAQNIFSTLAPACALDSHKRSRQGKRYMSLGGTSQATAAVSGLVALLRQARPDLQPHHYKAILCQSAYAGSIVQAEAALNLALDWP
ncbi:S8 family peptidase [bacterium]|nr:S8 family peptidase [bacterium]